MARIDPPLPLPGGDFANIFPSSEGCPQGGGTHHFTSLLPNTYAITDVSGVRCQVPGVRCQVSGCQVSGIRHNPVPGPPLPAYPLPDTQYPTPDTPTLKNPPPRLHPSPLTPHPLLPSLPSLSLLLPQSTTKCFVNILITSPGLPVGRGLVQWLTSA